eukprot:1157492-Pelagomonas_calceolata.AAC.5
MAGVCPAVGVVTRYKEVSQRRASIGTGQGPPFATPQVSVGRVAWGQAGRQAQWWQVRVCVYVCLGVSNVCPTQGMPNCFQRAQACAMSAHMRCELASNEQ